jgi:FMN-dependent NADH-azoreductase
MEAIEEVIERFKSADWYLFSLPMWNFGVPYVLKHFHRRDHSAGADFQF